MIGNDCPILSYMIHVFDKPDGWVETPQLVSESILLLPHERQRSRVCAIDCGMDMMNLHPCRSLPPTSNPSGSTTPSASTPYSCTTTLAVDHSNPGSHGLPRCHRETQTGGKGGHDPEEDARACVDLLRFKV